VTLAGSKSATPVYYIGFSYTGLISADGGVMPYSFERTATSSLHRDKTAVFVHSATAVPWLLQLFFPWDVDAFL